MFWSSFLERRDELDKSFSWQVHEIYFNFHSNVYLYFPFSVLKYKEYSQHSFI